MDCTIAASRGLGKTVVPTVIVVMGSCVFRVIWVYTIFAHFHTIPALYLLYPCSWALTAIAEILYFRPLLQAVHGSLQRAAGGLTASNRRAPRVKFHTGRFFCLPYTLTSPARTRL